MARQSLVAGLIGLVSSAWLAGCGGRQADVVLYCALDQMHSEKLIRVFEERTGLKVAVQFDYEASKSVGLTETIVTEASHPRCDVFWNNEIMNTLRLQQRGLLQPYVSPSAAAIPAEYRDPEGYWTGFAARARIFIINTDLMEDELPSGMWDLVNPVYKGRCGLAKPLAGTTATHMTALFDVLGEERMGEFLDRLFKNDIVITTGNAHLMRQVREGRLAFGFTDTDDFNVARSEGFPVKAVYPDQGPEGVGTMVIPNTVCMIKGCPHPDAARRLIDFILSEEVEKDLAFSRSAQIPVRETVERPEYVRGIGDFKVMKVDFVKAARAFADRSQELAQRFVN